MRTTAASIPVDGRFPWQQAGKALAAAAVLGACVLTGGGCGSAPAVDEQVKADAIPAGKDYLRQLPPGANALRKITDPRQIPDFRPGFAARDGILRAVRQSIFYLAAHPSSQLHFPSNDIAHPHCLESLRAFEEVLLTARDAEEFNNRLRTEFDTYISVGCDDEGTVLFTGYYRPIFEASRTPSHEYRHPLYRAPADLAIDRTPGPNLGKPLGRRLPDGSIVPYFSRAELDGGPHLRNQGLELVWLKDRFDVFTIHVQGSALLRMNDGSWMTVGYAGKTDRPYKSISQALIDDGKIRAEERSLTTLRRHFRDHPADLDRYLPINESYVFFQENRGGPYGSLGVEVTDLHTIATDKSIYPRASVAFLKTAIPGAGGVGKLPYAGFACDQDTGGAIRAAGRCDIFMGTGDEAGKVAGHTLSEGRLYYLFLKPENLGRQRGPSLDPTRPGPSNLPVTSRFRGAPSAGGTAPFVNGRTAPAQPPNAPRATAPRPYPANPYPPAEFAPGADPRLAPPEPGTSPRGNPAPLHPSGAPAPADNLRVQRPSNPISGDPARVVQVVSPGIDPATPQADSTVPVPRAVPVSGRK